MKTKSKSPPLQANPGNRPSPVEISDETFNLLSKLLEHKRTGRGLSQAQLARQAEVSLDAVKRLEEGKIGLLRLRDLMRIVRAIDAKLTVVSARVSQPLPTSNEEILAAFDLLLKKGKPNAFVRNARDKEFPGVFWDVVGDCDQNWLFVVASNRRTKVRFAKVTDEPGGWSIAGQRFGIDAETRNIADELSEQLIKQHRSALTTGESAWRSTRTPKKNFVSDISRRRHGQF